MIVDQRVEHLLADFDRESARYERLGVAVERLLKDLLRVAEIQTSSVSYRVKAKDSFERKIKSSDKYQCLTDVTDMVGARVITYFSDDIDRVAQIIHKAENFAVDLVNSVDKRRQLRPDQFGYQSLHLVSSLSENRIFTENRDLQTLKIEIQVRSLLQHAWAEFEHQYYKSEQNLPAAIARRVSRIAGLLELGDQEFITARRETNELARGLPICRAEGITEVVPEFSFAIPFKDIPLRSEQGKDAFLLTVNTNITNRVHQDGLTDVELHIEGGASPAARGVFAGTNALRFFPIFLPPPGRDGSLRIRVTGLRVNMFALWMGSTMIPTTIQAFISYLTDGSPALLASATVARTLPGLSFVIEGPGGMPIHVAGHASADTIVIGVRCRPGFRGAFRPAGFERVAEMSVVNGTRILLWLSPVPEHAQVSVSISNIASDGATSFRLTNTNAAGQGEFDPARVTAEQTLFGQPTRVAEAGKSGKERFATWECVAPVQETVLFGITLSLPANSGGDVIKLGVSLAPLSAVGVGDFVDPIPRFGMLGAPLINVVEVSN